MNGFSGVAEGLKRGYATAQTDGGHAIGEAFDGSWATGSNGKTDWIKVEDFSFRAIHETAELGKAVVAKYYGKAQSHAYFQGCSTGGRQGLMEA